MMDLNCVISTEAKRSGEILDPLATLGMTGGL
jgi:hypothetical protein